MVVPVQNGKLVTFTLSNLQKLRGTTEAGYGTEFDETDTKGSLYFEVEANLIGNKFKECSAIFNRSEIVFDCNPPIHTNFAITELRCVCDDGCTIDKFDTIPLNNPVIGQALSIPDLSHYKHFKWYPETGLNNVNVTTDIDNLNVTLADLKTRTYTLVATDDACHRRVLFFPVVYPCNLNVVNLKATPTGLFVKSCPQIPTYVLSAEAAGTGFEVKNLIWQDCSTTGVDHWSSLLSNDVNKKNVGPGTYFVSVKDSKTGCSDEQWITIAAPQALVIDDQPGNCMAQINVSGGTPPYTFEWTWNGQLQTFNGQSIGMSDKNDVSVTVTDAERCTATLSLLKSNCKGWGDNWATLYALVAVVILVFAFGIYFYIKKP